MSEEIDLNRLRRQVSFDRLLARLFREEPPPCVLKCGYALELRFKAARSTVDIDLTVQRIPATRQYTADLKPPCRGLGKAAGRRRGRRRHAGPAAPSRPCPQVRTSQLAHQDPSHCRMMIRHKQGRRAYLDGDSVPMPLGFIALRQAFACRGGDAAPNDARASVGAPVASLRCRILRRGDVQYKSPCSPARVSSLPDPLPARYNYSCPTSFLWLK